jgi:two-component system sensor histidine kinase BaeS
MRAIRFIRRHFGWKIFISYLLVTLVGAIVLASAVSLIVPETYLYRLGSSPQATPNPADGATQRTASARFENFQAGVRDALILALAAAMIAAIVASLFISQQVVAPIQEMMRASQRISNGNYRERVQVTGNVSTGELDELSQLALSFNQMAARLEQTENIRSQLIGDIAHELRTPLTTIKGYIEGLIDGVLPGDEETYQQVYHETERMQRLIDDLQELSRVEAGAYELNRQPVAVSHLINTVVARLGRPFDEKGVRLQIDLPEDLPPVLVDESRIAQVMMNLVGNALQYTPSGGQVIISALLRAGEVQVSISDSGIGISPDQLPLLFTRFYRVDKSRSRSSGGSGIGLTIAKYLVEAHGGRLWAESPGLGQGSAFYFTLPVIEF